MDIVPLNETHKIHDASKIQEYLTCPRKYFFRYVLGWVPDAEQGGHHKVFGHALHTALAYLYRNGFGEEQLLEASKLFFDEYREAYPDDMNEDSRAPKTAENGLAALARYVETYGVKDSELEVLHVEISGNVPVDRRHVHFRIDTIVRGEEGIFVLEHKTASRMSHQWVDQWRLKVQVGLYTHVLYSLYNPADVFGVKINGIFLYKSKAPEFLRVPVRMTPERMMVWLTLVRRVLTDIERNMNELERDIDRHVMESFPMNTESCTKYYGCPYIDLCTAWPNPLQRCSEPPGGFHIEWWDPRDEDTNTTEVNVAPKQLSLFDLLEEDNDDA